MSSSTPHLYVPCDVAARMTSPSGDGREPLTRTTAAAGTSA